jgi:hypothetical protein
MHKGADSQQEIVGLEITRIRESRIHLMGVQEIPASESPAAGEENPQPLVLDIKTVEPFAFRGGFFPLAPPKAAHMQEVSKRIEGRTYPIAEHRGQPAGIMD